MNRLLAFVVLVVVAIAAIGFWQGWFHVSRNASTQKTDVTITVDKEKVRADKVKAEQKVEELKKQARDAAHAD